MLFYKYNCYPKSTRTVAHITTCECCVIFDDLMSQTVSAILAASLVWFRPQGGPTLLVSPYAFNNGMQPSNLFILGTFEHNNGKIMLVYTVYEDDNISSHKLFELYSYWVQYYPVIVILPNSNFPPIQYGHSYHYLYIVFLMLSDV